MENQRPTESDASGGAALHDAEHTRSSHWGSSGKHLLGAGRAKRWERTRLRTDLHR
jgi:hypothetical protein